MKKTLITVILVILAATAVYFIFLDRGLNYDKQELKKTIGKHEQEIFLTLCSLSQSVSSVGATFMFQDIKIFSKS